MDYEQKFLLFKKLIDKTFSSYEKKYSVNFKNKTFVVKFILSDSDRLINLTIWPDSEWHEFKVEIEKYISSTSFNECYICLYQKNDVKACDKCSFTICDDCISEIIFANDMFRCPQCRYIPPHLIGPDIIQPYLSKLSDRFWVISNVRPPINNHYLSEVNSNFYATDEWINEMRNRYSSSEESDEDFVTWSDFSTSDEESSDQFWGEPDLHIS